MHCPHAHPSHSANAGVTAQAVFAVVINKHGNPRDEEIAVSLPPGWDGKQDSSHKQLYLVM